VFERGSIVEEGNHEGLMARPRGVYRGLFDMQSLGFVDTAAAG
jgi:ATP-binding cassette subfamily B protein